MKPSEIYEVLLGIRATHLHHANTVSTSCTFLEQGGLLSRGYVEDHHLIQTPQESDPKDKQFGIWHSVFLDHVDIHERAGVKKGPNIYGPVLFVFDSKILLHLPEGSSVAVTKRNPIYWQAGEPDSKRWFQSATELKENLSFGDFDKMLVVQTPMTKIDFPSHKATVFLDDPQTQLPGGKDAYNCAEQRLRAAAEAGGVEVSIEHHRCRFDCSCVQKYAEFNSAKLEQLFA